MEHVSDILRNLRQDLAEARDNEISMAAEVLGQYVTDHNDKSAYRAIDKQVDDLARAWDRMIAALDKWESQAAKIEQSCINFYGDPPMKMKLNQYQKIERHPSGLVRIVDGTAGIAHSAHPNVEDNRYNRRKYPEYTPAFGFLYSPEVFLSTELDHVAARLCTCPACR